MNLNQMKAFNALMLTGSVSEAARHLHRTQPAVSAQIAGLESALGMPLFERRSGRLHPVPEAHYLHEECKELLHRLDSVRSNMQEMKRMDRGLLLMVSMPGPSVALLPNMVATHLGPHPDANSTLISRSSDAVFELVAAQQYDLGLADYRERGMQETSLLRQTLYQFECLCAVPGDSPLASKQRLTPEDLHGLPFAMLYPEHSTHKATVAAFAEHRARINCRFMTQYFIPLLTFVQQGLVNAVVDPLTVETCRLLYGDDGNIQFRPFSPMVEFTVALLTPAHRPASQLAQSFHQFLHEELLRMGGRIVERG